MEHRIMETYKRHFIDFMVQSKVLTFGDFVTKSGRKTPFFINTGRYKTGEQIKKLGQFYAEAICAIMPDDITVLFGPAYKGIPLVVTTAIALSEKNRNISYCFNRKETKNHGEGGNLIGHTLTDKDVVLLIDDVATAGTSVRETIPVIKKEANAAIRGLIISVDRMEKGTGNRSALQELHDEFGLKTGAIVTLDDIVFHLYNKSINGTIILTDEIKNKIDEYRTLYGASS
jgi:orotate phosphoribosyltransferase